MIIDKTLYHYGTKRHSGRYPWGSGEDPYQHEGGWSGYVKELRAKGLSDSDIAKGLGMSTTEFRQRNSIAKDEKKAADISMANRLKEKGYSNTAIAEKMGIPESTVRNYLKPHQEAKQNSTRAAAEALKAAVNEKGYIDVGTGVELYMGISETKKSTAISLLKDEGYKVYYVKVQQQGTGQETNVMVLGKPDSSYKEVMGDLSLIKPLGVYSEDRGETFRKIEPPRSVDSKRVAVRYGPDGGSEMDGVIELRRGVDDISLGSARYAQVRIAVDGTHYLKGMAIYSDDLPDGVDIRFNTNKKDTGNKLDALKSMKADSENPFGATIKMDDELILAQRHYKDKNGKTQLSALNVVNEEGNWGEWSKSLSSQVLSKQPVKVAETQLGLAFDKKKAEFDRINSLTNPTVKKKLMDSFADDCDAASVHLKAAALPRQGSHVILPINSLKSTEIYAPNYKDGETVVLIRYPHGGRFEMPELTVNNKNQQGKSILGQARDAVGINHKVAERLSGADFDGDTVLVIPNNSGTLKTAPALKALKDFDPKVYKLPDSAPKMKSRTKQQEMGKVSNLITDMTIRGASSDEIARAVRHSMVVIDAEKHHLNYKQSFIDNGIADLKKKYQGSSTAGASTLISRASSTTRVTPRVEGKLVTDPKTGKTKRMYVDPETGKKLYTETPSSYTKTTVSKKTGGTSTKEIARTQEVSRMSLVEDTFELSSGSAMETVYATHANKLKALANQARKTSLSTQNNPYSPSAKKTYAKEVSSLNAKLNTALKNAPLERQAQILANVEVKAKKAANPDMDGDELKKIKGQALKKARYRVGASKTQVEISDSEWDAIQAGAISANKLSQILNNANMDKVKDLAMPKAKNKLSSSQEAKIRSMLSSGYTQAEIAEALSISTSTINEYI